MRKIIPLLVSILIVTTLYYIKSKLPEVNNWWGIELQFIEKVGTDNLPGVISLCIVTLITIVSLFTVNYSLLQTWFINFFITSFISRLFIGDISVNITSLSWLPIFKLSYLTAILASVIIILSLLLENGSYNEQKA